MRIRLLALALCALAFSSQSAAALDAVCPDGWTEATRKADIIIFYKDNEKVGVRELKAYAEIDATPLAVFRVVTDLVNYPKFMPYVKESTIVKQVSPSEVISYQKLSPPLVDDRDYVLTIKTTEGNAGNGGIYTSSWSPASDANAPVKDGIVRVHINSGSWTLEPVDGGKKTRVTYSLLTHPGGHIPAFIANKSNTIAIPDLFKAVRKRAVGG